MSEAEKMAQQQQQAAGKEAQRLALTDLETVKWMSEQDLVRGTYNVLQPRYQALRRTSIIGWPIVFFEVRNTYQSLNI